MSADLLRKAAAKLREQVGRLPEPWVSAPWRTVQTDTYNDDGIAACVNDHADDPHGAFDCCWSSEPIGHEAVASLAVLMHPPVGLALADWLESEAFNVDHHYPIWKDSNAIADADAHVEAMFARSLAVAREILREES